MEIHESSQVIPLPGVPTLFLDVQTAGDVTDSNNSWPPQDFRGFRLHRIIYLGVGPPAGQVAFPCQGRTVSHWVPTQRSVMTPELKGCPSSRLPYQQQMTIIGTLGMIPFSPAAWPSSEQGTKLLRPLEQPN